MSMFGGDWEDIIGGAASAAWENKDAVVDGAKKGAEFVYENRETVKQVREMLGRGEGLRRGRVLKSLIY